nr:hypothetical protein [Tanacetum cinerariifolium]
VKGIDYVSPIKSKATCNSDSPRRRRNTMSERNMLAGIALVVSDKLTDLEKDKTQNTPVKKPAGVVEKPDAIVDKAPKHKAPAKQPDSVVVQDKYNVTVPAKEPDFVVVLDKDNVVDALKNEAIEKVSDVVNDYVVVESVCDVVKASDALKNTAADVKEK